jgi:hypothetical protein
MVNRRTAVSVPLIGLLWLTTPAFGRDGGRYANSRLKPWFESLESEFGQCCTNADGYIVSDPDWESDHGHYRVRIDGQWVLVRRRHHHSSEARGANDGLEALHRRPSPRPLLHTRQHELIFRRRLIAAFASHEVVVAQDSRFAGGLEHRLR